MTDEMRNRLAAAISTTTTCDGKPYPSEFHYRQADVLLPVVHSIVVDQLRSAADELPITPGLGYVARDWLRRRADELDGPCSCVTTDPIHHCGECGCCA